jgi:hypothetical protein
MKLLSISIVFVMLIMLLLFSGCTTSQKNAQPAITIKSQETYPTVIPLSYDHSKTYVQYIPPSNEYTIYFPMDWNKTITSATILNQKVPIVGFSSPDQFAVVAVRTVKGVDPSESVDTWASDFVSKSTSAWSNFQLINSTKISISGIPARKIEFSGTGPSGKTTQNIYIISINKNTGYVVTYASLSNRYGQNLEKGQYILDSFKFL